MYGGVSCFLPDEGPGICRVPWVVITPGYIAGRDGLRAAS